MARLAPMLLAVSACGRLGFEPAPEPDAGDAAIDAVACRGRWTTELETLPAFLEVRAAASITINTDAGHLRFAMPPTPQQEGYVVTPIESFVERSAALHVTRILTAGLTSMGLHATESASHMGVDAGVLRATVQVDNSSVITLASRAYDPVTDAWWRLRETSEVLYYETSGDGVVWKQLAVTTSWGVTSTYLDFGCHTGDGSPQADEAHVERLLDCP
ncbi:MAG: hypothetical protein WKG01_37950 [Kofleriaceae bacterium]